MTLRATDNTEATEDNLLTWASRLMEAPRDGGKVDVPEGSRYCKLSETCVNQLEQLLIRAAAAIRAS